MCSTIALLRGGLPWIGALERAQALTYRRVMSYFRRDGHFSCDRCDEHGLLRLLGHSFGAQMGHRVGSRTLKRAKVAVTGEREAEKGWRIPKKRLWALKKRRWTQPVSATASRV